VKTYLGIDGGGTKTAFMLIDESGSVLATHTEGPAYYLEIGLEEMRNMLAGGIQVTAQHAGISPLQVTFAFLGLPSYGEDSRLIPTLSAAASPTLAAERYRCGNDALCGWAGALACEDGINIVAGTGSIAYGEFGGRAARAGGWGELFSDEGSAYWIAREGLRLFSRMSDGRAARGPLYDMVRRHFGLQTDLDLCAHIYGGSRGERSELASLSTLVSQAAAGGDVEVKAVFDQAANELMQIVNAVHDQLQVPDEIILPVSYSGGMFRLKDLLLAPLQSKLGLGRRKYRLTAPRMSAAAGAALYAAKLNGAPLGGEAISRLEKRAQQT
jgi:N-acetylglucosamine kinase-like BadF-type ATPase